MGSSDLTRAPGCCGPDHPRTSVCSSHPNQWARTIRWNHPRCQNKWHVVRFDSRAGRVSSTHVPNVGMARTVGQILVIQLLGHRRTCRTSPTGLMVGISPVKGMI